MTRSTAKVPPSPSPNVSHGDRSSWARTVALVVIASVVVLAASTQLTGLITPLILALVVAIALRPLADRIERLGSGRAASSILCTAMVALILILGAGLVVAQAGRVVRDSDRYVDRIGDLFHRITRPLEDSDLMAAINGEDAGEQARPAGPEGEEGAAPPPPAEEATGGATDPVPFPAEEADGEGNDGGPTEGMGLDSPGDWAEQIRQNAGAIGRWIVGGVGGALGVFGQVVVFLFLVLYILLTRTDWSDRIVRAGKALGMRIGPGDLDRMGRTIGKYVSCVLTVSLAYAVTIALVSWGMGLPQWAFWGVLTGFLVLVPYFGAVLAGAILVLVAAVSSQSIWPPLMMLGVYVLLQTLESYVILPMLYGEAVSIDPLAVMVGVLFFGLLWGPLGFVTALPVMVLIRGFVEVIPGSDPVGALLGSTDGVQSPS